jgi:hypothetical protein
MNWVNFNDVTGDEPQPGEEFAREALRALVDLPTGLKLDSNDLRLAHSPMDLRTLPTRPTQFQPNTKRCEAYS